ncbi:MAG: PQQ-dependent dehydrogenase, methanol/ethanol family [Gemmatimonadota bacterium]
MRRFRPEALALLVVGAAGRAAGQARAAKQWPETVPVGEWQLPGRDYGMTRFSPLGQITAANVSGLKPVWSFSTGSIRAHEGSPLVVGGTMYVHTPFPNTVYALDLTRAGAPMLWTYAAPQSPRAPTPLTGCCDVGSRGLAYHPSGKLYVPILSGELAAIDAKTGKEIWRVQNADIKAGATVASAPLVVKDLVIIGVSGADYGVRGYLTAYDANTGRLVWRGYSTGPDTEVLLEGEANSQYASHKGRDLGVTTWSGDSWQHGGATTGGWISYDPDLDLLFYGTDQAGPANPTLRPGDNKWAQTIFARVLATGKVKWAYQIAPHEEWGYGGANENILVDLKMSGTTIKALVHFDRNGFAYTLDRSVGKVLLAEKYGPANWALRIDLGTGLPVRDGRYTTATNARVLGVCPASIGAKYLQPAAFAPPTGLFYVPLNNLCMDMTTAPAVFTLGQPFLGVRIKAATGPGGVRGRFIAWDAATGSIAWEIKESFPVASGALATAGGLVFYGTADGWLKAIDAVAGRELWRFKTPSGIVSAPISFNGPDGRQYIAVLSGMGGWIGLGANGATSDIWSATNPGGVLTVFGL